MALLVVIVGACAYWAVRANKDTHTNAGGALPFALLVGADADAREAGATGATGGGVVAQAAVATTDVALAHAPLLPDRALKNIRDVTITVAGDAGAAAAAGYGDAAPAMRVTMQVTGVVRHSDAHVDFLGPGDEVVSVSEGGVRATNLRALSARRHGAGAAVEVCGTATCAVVAVADTDAAALAARARVVYGPAAGRRLANKCDGKGVASAAKKNNSEKSSKDPRANYVFKEVYSINDFVYCANHESNQPNTPLRSCQAKCRADTKCKFVTYFDDQGCHIVRDDCTATKKADPAWTGHPTVYSFAPPDFTKISSVDKGLFCENHKPNLPNTPLAVCQAKCRADPGCTHISWFSDQGCHIAKDDCTALAQASPTWKGKPAIYASPFLSHTCGANTKLVGRTCIGVAPSCCANERVSNNKCVACPAGRNNVPGTRGWTGNDASGPDTTCSTAILCSADQHVWNNKCVACPAGTTNVAGNDASGPDTTCTADSGKYSGSGKTSCNNCGPM